MSNPMAEVDPRMFKIVLSIILVLSSVVVAYKNSDEFIDVINSKQNLWKAGRNFKNGTPMSRIRVLLGNKKLPENILETFPLVKHNITDSEIPESFDARTNWAKCTSIKEVGDQSACGSCWALSTAAAISDRICIHSNATFQPEISAKDLMACDPLSEGCEGGFPLYAWQYWRLKGIVTGGPYNSKIGCQPYPFARCDHHSTGTNSPCPDITYMTPKCVETCDNSTISYKKDLIHGKSGYRVPKDEKQIQAEIMKNGPIVAGFEVYSDFIHYKSGVYHKTAGDLEGRHAVRVIGWGVENGNKYWLVMNSWNEDWGDEGLFKIRRGTNECNFEAEMSAGLPK